VTAPRKLTRAECLDLVPPSGVGRAAICASTGPQIFPVNYVVDGESIVFRTSAYSALGTLAAGAEMAFEVDFVDLDHAAGWSVVATGRAEAIDSEAELDMLRERGLEPTAWAGGLRRTYIRLRWTSLSGRVVGEG
jgi:nitroimidazol reductase NimA-like FMN-containing flavoprotein (pyridoxamine 5'-phosphate oxidase superfamily)